MAGMTTLNISAPCPEGYVCEALTNAERQFLVKCPAGYVCAFGTTPSTQFDLQCDAGYASTPRERELCMPCAMEI